MIFNYLLITYICKIDHFICNNFNFNVSRWKGKRIEITTYNQISSTIVLSKLYRFVFEMKLIIEHEFRERNKYTLENRITDNNFVTRRRYAISLLIARRMMFTRVFISVYTRHLSYANGKLISMLFLSIAFTLSNHKRESILLSVYKYSPIQRDSNKYFI